MLCEVVKLVVDEQAAAIAVFPTPSEPTTRKEALVPVTAPASLSSSFYGSVERSMVEVRHTAIELG